MEANNHFDVIVLGAGPAGLTTGIYLSRAKLKTLNRQSHNCGWRWNNCSPGGI